MNLLNQIFPIIKNLNVKKIVIFFFFLYDLLLIDEYKLNYHFFNIINKSNKKKILKNFNINENFFSDNRKIRDNISFIEIDNQFDIYENNIDYSNYSTDIKAIALYLPQFYFIKENDQWWGKNFTEWTMVRKAKPLYVGHHQPRKPGDEKGYLGYYYLTDPKIIKKQVKLAKSHGIYGFGFYYYWFSGKRLLEKPLDIFLENKDINFPFLLIWANHNWTRKWDGGDKKILIEQKYKKNDPSKFIKDIKKYVIDQRYITINGKKVIGIYSPIHIPHLKEIISIWRNKSLKYGIGKIYILMSLNEIKISKILNLKGIDAAYDFPPRNNIIIRSKKKLLGIYTELIYKWINFPKVLNKFPIFGGTMLEWDNSPRKGKNGVIFREFSQEKFYLLNKIIINWTRKNYNISNRFIFINAWNEWGEGSYLEPDEKYGYSSINTLSKSLFNLSYIKNYNISKLFDFCQIAVQVNVYYIDSIMEIINKTNNIPIKFDLYININLLNHTKIITKKIKKFSNANKYEIKYYEKKERLVYSFLKQIKHIFNNYKYFCHIHTKITNNNTSHQLGQLWENYLFNNLLGNKNIVLEILSYFENNKNLGFIFPETYRRMCLSNEKTLNNKDKKIMNKILKILFPNNKYRIGNNIDFPDGNMFWAKIKSIYQIINLEKNFYLDKDNTQNDDKIMFCIEKIWLYIVKLNGYAYKKIFKYY